MPCMLPLGKTFSREEILVEFIFAIEDLKFAEFIFVFRAFGINFADFIFAFHAFEIPKISSPVLCIQKMFKIWQKRQKIGGIFAIIAHFACFTEFNFAI